MKLNKLFIILAVTLLVIPSCYMIKKSDTYYGIDTQNTKKVVFLLDISGSMEGKAETDLKGNIISEATNKAADKVADEVGGIAGDIIRKQTKEQLTKLGKARKEMIPAIRGLGEGSYFTLIIFENKVKTWRKELIPATSVNKNLAITYLKQLESGGGTNIHGSLEKAFEFAGDGTKTTDQEIGVETIFLLTDGKPSSGAVTDTNGIIEAVNNWNSQKRITVHTIGLGEDCDESFLKSLATQNNGQYIDR